MVERRLALALLGALCLLLLASAGVALTDAFGIVGTDSTAAPATPTAGSDAAAAGTVTSVRPAFSLTTRDIEECGMLCRNVTSTLTNEQETAARNVTIRTRLYAGNDTDSAVRWRRAERVGTLDAGENYTVTREIALSLDTALAIRDANGWVTIRTTVTSDDRTVTVTDRRQVT